MRTARNAHATAPMRHLIRSVAALLLAASVASCATSVPRDGRFRHVTFSVLEDYDKGTDLSAVRRDFEFMKSLGVTTWRGSFGWDDYEPESGSYDLQWLHAFAELAAREGITLRPYIGYTPAWAGRKGNDEHAWNDPPRDLSSWRSFVRRLASELARHPNIPSYEIYNEQNTALWWEGDVHDYIPVLQAAADEIRAVDRDAEIVMGGLVWPDADWLGEVCEASRQAFDVAAIHAYPETWTESGVTVENYLSAQYDEFLEVARTRCGGKPVWINETGFATVPGKTERQQANWWLRAAATFAATEGISHVGIYEIKDLPPDQPVIGDAPNYHLGLLRVDRTPKLAAATVKMLVELLGTRRIAPVPEGVRVAGAGEVHHRFFERDDGSRVLFLWNDANTDVEIRLGRPARGAREFALDGSSAPVRGFDGTTVTTTAGPDVRTFVFD